MHHRNGPEATAGKPCRVLKSGISVAMFEPRSQAFRGVRRAVSLHAPHLHASGNSVHTAFAVRRPNGGLSSRDWLIEIPDVALFNGSARYLARNQFLTTKLASALDRLRRERIGRVPWNYVLAETLDDRP
jgi:hypothetical protein